MDLFRMETFLILEAQSMDLLKLLIDNTMPHIQACNCRNHDI